MINQKELRGALHYDARRGVWRWRVGRSGTAGKGGIAGTLHHTGYRYIYINGRRYNSSRLAWFYIRGYFPEHEVDHINRNPSDDRWCNLREASRQCNIRNRGMFKNNTSGVKGVHWHKQHEKWYAQIRVSGKLKHLGYHDDFTEAVAHRLAAEQCLDWSGCDSSSPAFKYMEDIHDAKTE